MLGAEKEIIATHVQTGQAKVVFWPLLDLGPNSLNAAAAAFCAGEQAPASFWAYHDTLFANQGQVFSANRGFYVDTAAALGLDGPAFESCYDGDAARALVTQLDQTRRDNGIFVRPTIAVNSELVRGTQPFAVFDELIRAQLP